MSKFLIIGSESMWCSIAFRLQEFEHHDVRMFCSKKEGKEHLNGIVKQVNSLQEGLSWLGKSGYVLSEDERDVSTIRRSGYKVLGGNRFLERVENDREFEMRTAQKAGIDIPNFHLIKSIDEGIKFIKSNPDAYALKQMGHAPKEWNYTGKEDDGSDVILQLEWIKQSPQFKKVGNVSFMLQEIVDGLELAVGAFWQYGDWLQRDGKVILEINREHKKMLNGDLGISCGEMGTVARFTTEDTKLFEQTLDKLTPILKKECSDVAISVDCNCGIVEEEDKTYLFEITPRTGYPVAALQEYLLDTEVGEFYINLLDGEDGDVEWKDTWGVVTNIGTGDYPHESISESHPDTFKNQPVQMIPDEHSIPAYLKYDKEKKIYRVADDYGWCATICFDDKDISKANEKCVEAMEKIIVRSPVYRTDIGKKFQEEEIPQLERMGYIEER